MFDRIRASYRARLFTAMFLLVSAVVASLGLYAQTTIKARMRADQAAELDRYARAAREILQARRPAMSSVDFDRLADQAGAAVGVRVTFLAENGQVLGDSAVDLPHLRELDAHGTRPEVVGALREGYGHARRYSRTLNDELDFSALAFEYDALDGSKPKLVARVAMPAELSDRPIDDLTRAIWLAGATALVLGAALAAWLTSVLSARLRQLARQVRGAARLDAGESEAVHDELERVAGSFGQLSSALERTVKTLADERDHFGAVLDSLGEAVIAVDAQWSIETVNAATRAMFGVEGELVGRPVLEVARVPEVARWSERPTAATFEETEFQLGTGRGARRIGAECFPRREGKGAVLVFRDLTEIRKLETMRTDFVANVSHELRTPISVISAAAETLHSAADDVPAPLVRFIEKIERNADRLGRLVADLLDLSRLEARPVGPERVRVDLRRTARNVATQLTGLAAERNTELVIRVPEGMSCLGDAGSIEQILTNLVENALKYAGGKRVEIWASRTDEAVSFGVDDEGLGIPDEHLPRLFERFYRVDPGRSRDMGGTGLGLAIVKHLAEGMGGSAIAEHREPRGMRFRIDLPES